MKKLHIRLVSSSRVETDDLSIACEKLRDQLGDAYTSHVVEGKVGIFTLDPGASLKYSSEAIRFMGFEIIEQAA